MPAVQKSFGEFIADHYGPKWVYAHRATDRIRSQHPGATVITPKQQRNLAVNYRALYGREHDAAAWAMLCALRTVRNAAPAGAPWLDDVRAAISLETGFTE